jgi:transposase InsO family protein
VNHLGIHQIKIAPRSPWQSGYAERFVGTLRRELLDHPIVLGERHLRRAIRDFVAYYNADRPHMSLGGDAPVSRPDEFLAIIACLEHARGLEPLAARQGMRTVLERSLPTS